MNDCELISKLESLKQSPSRIVFGYRYYKNKLDNYIGISNLRLEITAVNKGKITYTLAAPLLQVSHGKNKVLFVDHGAVYVLDGPKANIILREEYAPEDCTVSTVAHMGTTEVTPDTDLKLLETVINRLTSPAYPGLDMRLPRFYRCTKNPNRLRLNDTAELLSALGVEVSDGAEVIQQAFQNNLDAVAGKTSQGYVFPFEYVNAGGMIVAEANNMGNKRPTELYVRSVPWFKNYASASGWEIQI